MERIPKLIKFPVDLVQCYDLADKMDLGNQLRTAVISKYSGFYFLKRGVLHG